MKLPHPIILLIFGVALCAVLTWVLPAGEYDRRDDATTGRRVVVAGTYHRVDASPVGPFAAAVAIPRGFVEAADVIGVVLFVGGAWVVVDRIGTLRRLIAALVSSSRGRGLIAIPIVALFFAVMGALENMQEEIIPLVPVLMALGGGIGVDGVTVVAMSAGAAWVGAAFGPTNPFQAGIALKVAQLPPLGHMPGFVAVLLMIPFHGLIHVPVPSASGHAVLTMPLFAPIADLLGFSREATVIAYQTGGGLAQMLTPTNGALMAILLAANVPLQRWLRFAAVGIALLVLVGVFAAALAM